MDLLLHHQLVINNDMAKVNSAASHEIRNHFNEWVADQLPQVVASPEMLEYLQSQKLPDHRGPQYGLGARYNFASLWTISAWSQSSISMIIGSILLSRFCQGSGAI